MAADGRRRALGGATRRLQLLMFRVRSDWTFLSGKITIGQGGNSTASREGSGQLTKAGARTLSHYGDHVYPDTGNGGYISLHTDIRLVYSATANRFLRGNHVRLTDRATKCLTEFSLDFERRSLANVSAGPDMKVNSVLVNGRRAAFSFVQPTYPGDPHGMNDPDPRAHEASQLNPVGGPAHNPLPPACSPELTSTSSAKRNSQDGQQCPANKLVIKPATPILAGSRFTVTVHYTGRPGVHTDGDGTTEGWFVSNKPAGDGGFVTTEDGGSRRRRAVLQDRAARVQPQPDQAVQFALCEQGHVLDGRAFGSDPVRPVRR
jgi:hypothetical protein